MYSHVLSASMCRRYSGIIERDVGVMKAKPANAGKMKHVKLFESVLPGVNIASTFVKIYFKALTERLLCLADCK